VGLERFEGSIDRKNDFVDAIVDVDFMDMVSFSDGALVLF
jgi:hypothetical protein